MLTKSCSKCNIEKPLDDFHAGVGGKGGRRGDCKVCVRLKQQIAYDSDPKGHYERRKSTCECGVKKSPYSEKCQACARPPFNPESPRWRLDSKGYLVAKGPSKEIRQHRMVMEKSLGRELLPHENVHHINGVRDDNRLENLELWSISQPAGQRVSDKVQWCKEFLAQYEEDESDRF